MNKSVRGEERNSQQHKEPLTRWHEHMLVSFPPFKENDLKEFIFKKRKRNLLLSHAIYISLIQT